MPITKIDSIQGGCRSVLDTIFCSILVFDGEGQLIYYNAAAQTFFQKLNIDVAKALCTPFEEFTQPLSAYVNLINGKGRHMIDLDGIHVVCNVHAWIVGGSRQGTVILLHESAHSHCVMQELDVTNSLLQEINIFVESSHDGFLVTDSQGMVIRVNAAFERAFSIPRQDVLGRNVAELVKEGHYPESAALNVINTQEAAIVVIEREEKRLIATGTPAFDACGEFASVVVNLRDITELNDLQNKLEHHRMVAQGYIQELNFLQNQSTFGGQFVTHSKAMRQITDTVKAIAQVDSTLLITGEPGTGKEMVVNLVHRSSNRANQPIIRINCGAIPAALFEAELYGYEDGAFTGVRQKGKAGFFEMAHKGTLFLDEIGELDLDLQVKLFRVIQEGAVTRIGGVRKFPVDVRMIATRCREPAPAALRRILLPACSLSRRCRRLCLTRSEK